MATQPVSNDALNSSYFQYIKESKWTDIVLITSCVAFLIIGILASTGLLDSMGTTNASSFSYGMYTGAALFCMAEVIKIALNCCAQEKNPFDEAFLKKSVNEQITRIEFSPAWAESFPIQGRCTITFSNGIKQDLGVNGYEAHALIRAIGRNKCSYVGYPDRHPENNLLSYASETTAQSVLKPVFTGLNQRFANARVRQ